MNFTWCNGYNITKLKKLIKDDFRGFNDGADICGVIDKDNLKSAYLSVYDDKLCFTLNKHESKKNFNDEYENVRYIEIPTKDIVSLNNVRFIKFIFEKFDTLVYGGSSHYILTLKQLEDLRSETRAEL